jgi:hypothetical protein
MAALGNVLYRIGCILAGLLVVGGIWFMMLAAPTSQNQTYLNLEYLAFLVLFLFAALLVWGVGRGLKYVLTGQ